MTREKELQGKSVNAGSKENFKMTEKPTLGSVDAAFSK